MREKEPLPVIIIMDRYGGCYSGAKWVAWNKHAEPEGSNGGDVECSTFWYELDEPFGKGATPQEAYEDLKSKLNSEDFI